MRFSEKRSQRMAAGLSLIIGPALTLAGWSVFPSVTDGNTAWADDIAANTTRGAFGLALAIVGITISIFAYMSLVHLQRERQALAADIGGTLAIVGACLMAGLMGLVLGQVETIRHLGSSTETVALLDTIDDSAAAIVLWLGAPIWTAGLLVLAFGMARAHATPLLVAGALGLGALVQFAGLLVVTSIAVAIVGFALMFLAMGFIGWQVLTETDEEWEHVPVFDGFHRVTAA